MDPSTIGSLQGGKGNSYEIGGAATGGDTKGGNINQGAIEIGGLNKGAIGKTSNNWLIPVIIVASIFGFFIAKKQKWI